MDLKQLETFITVVEWDSFSEAAKRLYLTQPTISTHIKQIENELNTELLKRTTKKLELTPEGREFYNYAKSISRIMESMQDSFSKRASLLLISEQVLFLQLIFYPLFYQNITNLTSKLW